MPSEMEGRLWAAMPSAITDDLEERQQIARAREGDEAAIGWLIARYRLRAVRLAAHVLRRPSEAEDVAQEAFVRAFRNLHGFREQGRFYTWLYQIIVRVCLDRQNLKRWDAETMLDTDRESRETTNAPMEAVETRLLVETLLDRLTPPMRAMLVLRELEGLEYAEIAQTLRIPVGRVRWRLHRARHQFRELWEAAMEEVGHV